MKTARTIECGPGWRVLVVDDYTDTAEIIAECFELLGCESRFATSGRAAIDIANAIEPHMVVLDLVLPDLDGFDVARELRRGACRHSYLVALTGSVGADVRACARHAGFDRLLRKSIGLADIRELVTELAATVRPASRTSLTWTVVTAKQPHAVPWRTCRSCG